jgi:hypothetical protein
MQARFCTSPSHPFISISIKITHIPPKNNKQI